MSVYARHETTDALRSPFSRWLESPDSLLTLDDIEQADIMPLPNRQRDDEP